MSETEVWDAVVVGGGLAGLTAAARLTKLGRTVLVLEAANALGGRGRTQEKEGGFLFNMGAHALYRKSCGARILKDLGVQYSGHVPATSGNYVSVEGKLAALPGGAVSIFTTKLFRGWREKSAALKSFAAVMSTKPRTLTGLTVSQWLSNLTGEARVRDFFKALLRLVTYVSKPDQLCAEAALEQLQKALTGNVLYLDGGWGTLVNSFSAIVKEGGGTIHLGERVCGLSKGDHFLLETQRGSISARTVLLACPPDRAARLISGVSQKSWDHQEAVKASCLDLALSRLPDPKKTFVLGVDEPSYISVHSKYANLAPKQAAVIHCMLYGGAEQLGVAETRRVLEDALDRAQPGWREVIVHESFLPNLTVAGGFPDARLGGMAGRPGVCLDDQEGLYLCGDWVGDEGQLADASFASADKATRAAASFLKSSVCGVA